MLGPRHLLWRWFPAPRSARLRRLQDGGHPRTSSSTALLYPRAHRRSCKSRFTITLTQAPRVRLGTVSRRSSLRFLKRVPSTLFIRARPPLALLGLPAHSPWIRFLLARRV